MNSQKQRLSGFKGQKLQVAADEAHCLGNQAEKPIKDTPPVTQNKHIAMLPAVDLVSAVQSPNSESLVTCNVDVLNVVLCSRNRGRVATYISAVAAADGTCRHCCAIAVDAYPKSYRNEASDNCSALAFLVLR